ncbi:predicted protein [Naegleria gruberi]|nr:uncharacterized protein NAEGRDRAFT_54891 [Naegleria gruberi]EFC35483.1 predicted protein [Naegleria gruberi]|eukprot:XP_002668227.1 predicted protein [Naegleria gruberi strain NEG-M]
MCHSKIPLVANFANRILNGLGIKKREINKGDVIRVLFISRRPYVKFGVEHNFMSRQISNEEEVLDRMKTHREYGKKFTVERVDFAHLKLVEQIQKVHDSDFLIGYHGAGLTHSLWMPEETSAVLEIWNTVTTRGWRCFEQFTFWKGNDYTLWSNSNPKNLRKDSLGDYLTVDVADFYKTFDRMVNKLIDSRN